MNSYNFKIIPAMYKEVRSDKYHYSILYYTQNKTEYV